MFEELSQAVKDDISRVFGAHHTAKSVIQGDLGSSLSVTGAGGASTLLFLDGVRRISWIPMVPSHT